MSVLLFLASNPALLTPHRAAFAAHYEFKKIIPAWDLPGVQPPQRVTIGCSHGN